LEIVEVNCFLRPIHGKPVLKEEGVVQSLNNIKQTAMIKMAHWHQAIRKAQA